MRYIDSLNIKVDTECFILIEPGLGYLVHALREKFKHSKIITLHIDKNFPQAGDAVLYCTDPVSAQDFLEKEVPEIDASRILIIEWRPSLNFYREAYVKLLSQVVEFIKRMDAGKRTVSAFGKRWVRNFFRNIGNVRETLLYNTMDIPVIITGSGPSLEEAIPVIKDIREKSLVIAASSSVMALSHGGIRADIVIAADGGAWALRHIYPYFRNTSAAIAFAANLCAALPSQCGGVPWLIINDGSLWQSVILHELSLPSVIIPQRGTVTAAAVELALILSGGNIYLAGMDLCVRDIRTHARPYGFDYLFFENAGRISPAYSKCFTRSRQIQDGSSLDIYSAWFRKQLASWPERIFSLGGNHEVFGNISATGYTGKETGKYFKAVPAGDDPATFSKRGAAALLVALKDSRYTESLKTELAPLLFPDKKEVTEHDLEKAISEAAYE